MLYLTNQHLIWLQHSSGLLEPAWRNWSKGSLAKSLACWGFYKGVGEILCGFKSRCTYHLFPTPVLHWRSSLVQRWTSHRPSRTQAVSSKRSRLKVIHGNRAKSRWFTGQIVFQKMTSQDLMPLFNHQNWGKASFKYFEVKTGPIIMVISSLWRKQLLSSMGCVFFGVRFWSVSSALFKTRDIGATEKPSSFILRIPILTKKEIKSIVDEI